MSELRVDTISLFTTFAYSMRHVDVVLRSLPRSLTFCCATFIAYVIQRTEYFHPIWSSLLRAHRPEVIACLRPLCGSLTLTSDLLTSKLILQLGLATFASFWSCVQARDKRTCIQTSRCPYNGCRIERWSVVNNSVFSRLAGRKSNTTNSALCLKKTWYRGPRAIVFHIKPRDCLRERLRNDLYILCRVQS